MKRCTFATVVIVLVLVIPQTSAAQAKWTVGGRLGMSILDGSSGVQIGPMAELQLDRNMSFGLELDINTQNGTPLTWSDYLKYHFTLPNSNIIPYADAGIGLTFATGGPFFGIQFGGGALFEITPQMYVPADLQLGPVFAKGTTIFYIAVTSGIRYRI